MVHLPESGQRKKRVGAPPAAHGWKFRAVVRCSP
jgi:hypothetical protein